MTYDVFMLVFMDIPVKLTTVCGLFLWLIMVSYLIFMA